VDTHPVLVTELANRVLAVKEGDTFLYSDTHGNLDDSEDYGLGFYHRDTRFLSHFVMRINGREPVLLSSSAERAYMSHVDMTNPDLYEWGVLAVPQQTLNVRRVRTVRGRLYERIRIRNYNPHEVNLDVEFSFGADFADIFEVRGMESDHRGETFPPKVDSTTATFSYKGRDATLRETVVTFAAEPKQLRAQEDRVSASFRMALGPFETGLIELSVEPRIAQQVAPEGEFDTAVHSLRRSYEEWERHSTGVVTDNEVFNQLLSRSLRDMRALRTATADGHVIAAGIPWYVAVFGRDSLISSHQMLMVNPRPARETLELLARYQGTQEQDWRDEQPGKILHELRQGELANAGVVPHTPYYGSVDSTPWFLILLAQYFRWTADREFVARLIPAAEAALGWIDGFGDSDGDGFVEYLTRSEKGIRNQGWKDSYDSVSHVDGRLAQPPVALAEVQGYVYLAKERMAGVFAALGDLDRSESLMKQAALLKERFNEAFWMEEEKYFAGALDSEKEQVRSIVSNPGHALYCGIVDEEKAPFLAKRLLAPDMFSGWGIRTLSKEALRYNPMSYHNGSVWPHDNALIAAGLKRYGFVKETNRVATALFDAAIHADYMRLPELFCGFTRRSPNRPVSYPVACSPQAWAAGSPFLMLQGILGISARAHENLLTVNRPHLPPWMNTVELRNLRVGESVISLVFRREGDITSFSLISREGDVRVVMEE
jgi:glycogen debranching enzyme